MRVVAGCEYYVILYQGRRMDRYQFDFQSWSVTCICLRDDRAWR